MAYTVTIRRFALARNYRESKKNFHEFLLDFKKRKINYSTFLSRTLRRILFHVPEFENKNIIKRLRGSVFHKNSKI